MARIRYLKPEFFFDDDLARLDFATRLFFQGLWCYADREGRLEDKPKVLKAQIMPYDKIDTEKTLNKLNGKFITRYTLNEHKYIQVNNFTKHQKPHHTEVPSEIPSCEGILIINPLYPSDKIRKQVYERDNYICQYCETDLRNESRKICLDHIIPICKNGSNGIKNLVVSCKKCNAVKYNKTPEEAGIKYNGELGETVGYRTVNGTLTISGQDPNHIGTREREVKEKEKLKNKKNIKRRYYDFVFLSKDEFQNLLKNSTPIQTKENIKNLNNYLGSTGKKYKSHYHTILNWRNKNERQPTQEVSRKDAKGKKDQYTGLNEKDYHNGAF